MKFRSAQWGKKSPGSRVLGMILSKFNAYKEGSGPIAGYFTRKICVRVTAAEENYKQMVLDCSMGVDEARAYLEKLDFDTPFRSRIGFVRAIAALVSVFPKEVAKPCPPKAKPLSSILYHACMPGNIEYMLNNTRRLHTVDAVLRGFLAAGSCSVEALHSEITNLWWKNTPSSFISTVKVKVRIFRLAKLWTHDKMMSATTNRSYNQITAMSRSVASYKAWCDASWTLHCEAQPTLPLCDEKEEHRTMVKTHNAAQPAAEKNKIKINKQNTLFLKLAKKRKKTPRSTLLVVIHF
jgi:hypothetical protein